MELYILDETLTLTAIVDDASSVIWAKRYSASGDFEIYTRATKSNIDVLRVGYYVTRSDDDMVGIIESAQITSDIESGAYLTVKGRDASSLLGRRVVWTQTVLNGTAEAGIRKLITDAVISPSNAKRKIDIFTLGASKGFTDALTQQLTGDNLLDAVSKICEAFSMGYKTTLQDGKLVFDLYKGIDRSADQTTVPRVIFSPEFDNLAESDYLWDETEFSNVALVAGEGEGTARKTTAVGDSSGVDRYEIFVDARDVSSNDGEISTAEYTELLYQRGVENLADAAVVERFSGEIITGQTYEYKVDYDVGDVVTVQNEYGISATVRITAVTESEDETGKKIIPTFDYGRAD